MSDNATITTSLRRQQSGVTMNSKDARHDQPPTASSRRMTSFPNLTRAERLQMAEEEVAAAARNRWAPTVSSTAPNRTSHNIGHNKQHPQQQAHFPQQSASTAPNRTFHNIVQYAQQPQQQPPSLQPPAPANTGHVPTQTQFPPHYSQPIPSAGGYSGPPYRSTHSSTSAVYSGHQQGLTLATGAATRPGHYNGAPQQYPAAAPVPSNGAAGDMQQPIHHSNGIVQYPAYRMNPAYPAPGPTRYIPYNQQSYQAPYDDPSDSDDGEDLPPSRYEAQDQALVMQTSGSPQLPSSTSTESCNGPPSAPSNGPHLYAPPPPAQSQQHPPPAAPPYQPPPAQSQQHPPPAQSQQHQPPPDPPFQPPPAHPQQQPPLGALQYQSPPVQSQQQPPLANPQYQPPPAHPQQQPSLAAPQYEHYGQYPQLQNTHPHIPGAAGPLFPAPGPTPVPSESQSMEQKYIRMLEEKLEFEREMKKKEEAIAIKDAAFAEMQRRFDEIEAERRDLMSRVSDLEAARVQPRQAELEFTASSPISLARVTPESVDDRSIPPIAAPAAENRGRSYDIMADEVSSTDDSDDESHPSPLSSTAGPNGDLSTAAGVPWTKIIKDISGVATLSNLRPQARQLLQGVVREYLLLKLEPEEALKSKITVRKKKVMAVPKRLVSHFTDWIIARLDGGLLDPVTGQKRKRSAAGLDEEDAPVQNDGLEAGPADPAGPNGEPSFKKPFLKPDDVGSWPSTTANKGAAAMERPSTTADTITANPVHAAASTRHPYVDDVGRLPSSTANKDAAALQYPSTTAATIAEKHAYPAHPVAPTRQPDMDTVGSRPSTTAIKGATFEYPSTTIGSATTANTAYPVHAVASARQPDMRQFRNNTLGLPWQEVILMRYPTFHGFTQAMAIFTKQFLTANGVAESTMRLSGQHGKVGFAIPQRLFEAYTDIFEGTFADVCQGLRRVGEPGQRNIEEEGTMVDAIGSPEVPYEAHPQQRPGLRAHGDLPTSKSSTVTADLITFSNNAMSMQSGHTIVYIDPNTRTSHSTSLTAWTDLVRARYPRWANGVFMKQGGGGKVQKRMREGIKRFLEVELRQMNLTVEACMAKSGRRRGSGRKVMAVPGCCEPAFWRWFDEFKRVELGIGAEDVDEVEDAPHEVEARDEGHGGDSAKRLGGESMADVQLPRITQNVPDSAERPGGESMADAQLPRTTQAVPDWGPAQFVGRRGIISTSPNSSSAPMAAVLAKNFGRFEANITELVQMAATPSTSTVRYQPPNDCNEASRPREWAHPPFAVPQQPSYGSLNTLPTERISSGSNPDMTLAQPTDPIEVFRPSGGAHPPFAVPPQNSNGAVTTVPTEWMTNGFNPDRRFAPPNDGNEAFRPGEGAHPTSSVPFHPSQGSLATLGAHPPPFSVPHHSSNGSSIPPTGANPNMSWNDVVARSHSRGVISGMHSTSQQMNLVDPGSAPYTYMPTTATQRPPEPSEGGERPAPPTLRHASRMVAFPTMPAPTMQCLPENYGSSSAGGELSALQDSLQNPTDIDEHPPTAPSTPPKMQEHEPSATDAEQPAESTEAEPSFKEIEMIEVKSDTASLCSEDDDDDDDEDLDDMARRERRRSRKSIFVPPNRKLSNREKHRMLDTIVWVHIDNITGKFFEEGKHDKDITALYANKAEAEPAQGDDGTLTTPPRSIGYWEADRDFKDRHKPPLDKNVFKDKETAVQSLWDEHQDGWNSTMPEFSFIDFGLALLERDAQGKVVGKGCCVRFQCDYREHSTHSFYNGNRLMDVPDGFQKWTGLPFESEAAV
ncbi:uncharacterized protein EV422DRAFT_576331 [Fimicolochytrium jonesii]|uniref:uncharacterized protein n=1 Tax=Fimicolochytrium jonesii TaxID=1396493 RepID=UPI0022FE64E3|nr:uncharacterized protein EV422DRAFT_576331 [Fimicolochytrium jonesii]KAI8825131.1 hypothetical protein EV422DRAFT_576331 [Fimicolochytrium jonesii]